MDKCSDLVGAEINVTDEGEAPKVTGLSNMTVGDTCSFRMSVKCGSPFFNIMDFKETTINGGELLVTYIELDANNSKAMKMKGEKSGERGKTSSPFPGYPARNANFSYAGKATPGKQELPKVAGRKGKKDIKNLKNKKDAEEEASKADNAVAGFGQPTWGLYNASEGGFKSFGTSGQGSVKEGIKQGNDSVCKPRKMLVTITAVAKAKAARRLELTNSTPTTLTLSMGTAPFIGEIGSSQASTGATYLLKSALIGTLAVVSYLM